MKSLTTSGQITDLSPWVMSRRLLYDAKIALKANQYLHIDAIIDAIHEPVLILDRNLNIQSANNAYFQQFKSDKENIYGMNLADLSARPSAMQHLIKRLKKLSTSNASIEALELTYPFEKIGERTLLINAKRITYDN